MQVPKNADSVAVIMSVALNCSPISVICFEQTVRREISIKLAITTPETLIGWMDPETQHDFFVCLLSDYYQLKDIVKKMNACGKGNGCVDGEENAEYRN